MPDIFPRPGPAAMTAQEILARLVAFPTVSESSNLALLDWVAGYLAGHGVESHLLPNATGEKASLFAVIGPRVAGGVALSGHTDVVPIKGQAWSSDPFVLTERDGKLFGRGAVDMKGFLATMLAIVPQAVRAPLKRPIYLAFSHDEEIGCEGCIDMVQQMARDLPVPQAVIVGEPSNLRVIEAHKGSIAFRLHVTGHSVHSSLLHTGVSAIMEAAELIHWANETNTANRAAPPSAVAAAFNPPWTTVHVGTIAGGTANNITAAECHFALDFRVVPDERLEDWDARMRAEVAQVVARMRAIEPATGIEIEQVFRVPPLAPDPARRAARLTARLTGSDATDVVSFGTEAGHFQAAGWPTVVCGPGDIARAHKADEFIAVDELEAGVAMLRRLIAELS